MRTWSGSGNADPPQASGIDIRNTPAVFSASTRSRGSRRASAISSARPSISGSSASTRRVISAPSRTTTCRASAVRLPHAAFHLSARSPAGILTPQHERCARNPRHADVGPQRDHGPLRPKSARVAAADRSAMDNSCCATVLGSKAIRAVGAPFGRRAIADQLIVGREHGPSSGRLQDIRRGVAAGPTSGLARRWRR
jgi:hypothetical protein